MYTMMQVCRELEESVNYIDRTVFRLTNLPIFCILFFEIVFIPVGGTVSCTVL